MPFEPFVEIAEVSMLPFDPEAGMGLGVSLLAYVVQLMVLVVKVRTFEKGLVPQLLCACTRQKYFVDPSRRPSTVKLVSVTVSVATRLLKPESKAI